MTAQFLQYVREELILATADLSGATKGQLQAWLEDAQFDTGRFKRKKQKIIDADTGKLITLDNPPIPGKRSHAKGTSIALIQQVEYRTASWRRALLSLSNHQNAWLMWNYSESMNWEYQEEITRWAWKEFSHTLAGSRVAKKTVERLRPLIWLAAQDAKNGLAGRDVYQYADLAALVGVTEKNWSKTFTAHWVAMLELFGHLDRESLRAAARARSQQKAVNSRQSVAKVD